MVRAGYKETPKSMIPEEWATSPLSVVGPPKMCKRVLKDQTSSEGEIPFYKIGTFGKEADAFISRSLFESFKNRFSYPKKGDILLSAAGTIGRTVVFDGREAYFQDSNIVWLDNDEQTVLNAFLYYCYHIIKWQTADGGTVSRLYNTLLSNTLIAYPTSKDEQRAIVSTLSDIDSLIMSLEKLIIKKKNIRHGIMQELLTGERRIPGFSGKWKSVNLSKTAQIKARIGWQGLTTSEYLDDGYSLLVTGTDFENGRINWETCHYVTKNRFDQDPYIQLNNGDVLITKDGTIGKIAVVEGLKMPATLNSGVFVVRPLSGDYTEHFLFYVLMSNVFRKFITELMAGSTITHLYQKDLVKFNFLVPPTKEEQDSIVEILHDMDEDIRKAETLLCKYRMIKKGMMQELLTGEIRLVSEV